MAEWWQAPPVSYDLHPYVESNPYFLGQEFGAPQAQSSPPGLFAPNMPPPLPVPASPMPSGSNTPKQDSPREIRNKAEKQRRDKFNQSIAQLAALVPHVVCSTKKVDKVGVLRYTAHYLRAHKYVFDVPTEPCQFSSSSTTAVLDLLRGFVLTTTYKGLIVVVSENINKYLGHNELDLLGRSVFSMVHKDDHALLRDQLMPRSQAMGQHGELIMPCDVEGRRDVKRKLANEKRLFLVRFLKLGNRTEPSRYVTCHVEGSFRVSDHVMKGYNRCCPMVRRARARGDNPCNSGNDVVFVGVVRPCTESFINESAMEFHWLAYRTRHSIDGEIIQCEQRISLVTGYLMNEVSGINAMNFIHREEVRWVIMALKEMYNQNQVYGESCYRLLTKNGQFVYMRTQGRLDVDTSSRAVTSFVCTNTVVDEREGKHLIRQMKERYTVQARYEGDLAPEESSGSQALEDPRRLEKAILNMVTTLPPPEDDINDDAFYRGESPSPRFALVTHKRERIVSAIEKIHTILDIVPKLDRSESPEPTMYDEVPEQHQYEETNEVFTEEPETMPYHWSYTEPNSFIGYIPGQETSDGGYNSEYSPVVPSSQHVTSNGAGDDMLTQLANDIFNAEDDLQGRSGPSTSNGTAGVKRPNQFEEEENTTKKKVTVVEEEEPQTTPTNGETTTLESFFDNDVLNANIDSAISTLEEEAVATNFPDFLSSSEIENILDDVISEPTEES